MNTQRTAKWFSVIFILVGILGFIPGVTADGYLFGIFESSAILSVAYLVSGIFALLCVGSQRGAKSYFKIFGVVYALLAILGFIDGSNIFNLLIVNGADNVLHLLVAVVALVVGFGGPKKPMSQVVQR